MDATRKTGKLGTSKENGFATILLAGIMGLFLILFFVVGIDFARIYYVKGELQNAADAAALAGAAVLDGTNSVAQAAARTAAVTFAGQNNAAGTSVGLASDGTNALSDANDILVGNWNGTDFLETRKPVNAVQVRARRTANSPGGPVVLLFGNMVGWVNMSPVRNATASRVPPPLGPFPICLPSCDRATPIDGQWEFDGNPTADIFAPGGTPAGFKAEDAATLCTDTSTSTPGVVSPAGQHFYLNSSQDMVGMAWTNFDLTNVETCGAASKCGDNPDPDDITPYIKGEKIPPDICGKAICITNGTGTGPLVELLKNELPKRAKDHIVGGKTIHGWRITLPIVLDCSGGQSCPGDPTGRPYPVMNYANVIITEVLSSGDDPKKGMRLVGTSDPRTITYTCRDKKGIDTTRTRTVTSIGPSGVCASCSEPIIDGSQVKLVK
ncbi:MAG: pilus assembly protein [Nitrospirae bacterium]|nr:pilus assembly protein [Nitrospirota bacterium]